MAKLKTGRHTSPIKELRKTNSRNAHNRVIKRDLRLIAKQVELAIAGKNAEEAKKLLPKCFSVWDKAVKINLIHKNVASRKKARLSAKIAKLAAPAAA
jgi:small subunit ribosomal protein S20